MNAFYRLTALLLGTTVMVAQPFHWGKAVAGISIGKLAPEVTVFIQGVRNPDNFGSGVVIGRSGKSYLVLTAAHVVAAADQYTVQASDGVQYTLQNIRKLPNVDIAVVQFDSSSTYTVAQMGNSDDVNLTTGVYVAGYPKPGQNIRVPVLTITNGEIAQVLPTNASVDGYGFAYTNSTRVGMSGGPVFNSLGEVIAIHGRKEGEAGGGATNGAWLNLGIPINRYKSAGVGTGGTQIAAASNVDLQEKAREAAQRKVQEQAQRQAKDQQAQRQAALESQRQAQEQARQRAAAVEAQQQRQAKEQAQQQAAEAQRQAAQARQQTALETQQRQAKEQAQQQASAALEAQRQAQQNIQEQQANAQRQSQISASAKNLLASASPFVASFISAQPSTISSTREVCKDVRINTIVVKRCSTEVVNQIQESASVPSSKSSGNVINNGNARAAGGNYQAAVDEYTAAIQSNSGLAIAFFNRGLAHYNLGQRDRAVSDFSKAADLFRSQGDSQKFQKTQDILQALTQSNS